MTKKHNPAKPRRKYDYEFKNEAVRLVTIGQRSVPDVARALDISENILYRWKGHGKPNDPQNGVSQQEYDQLRRTEQERDILKSVYSAHAVE
ncbi:transposase [Spirosoma litoris]